MVFLLLYRRRFAIRIRPSITRLDTACLCLKPIQGSTNYMGRTRKKILKKIGIGRDINVDNKNFVLDALWPDGTWNLLMQDGAGHDLTVRRWLMKLYMYEH